MLILHGLELIYIRVPKTGSTSFVNALDELDPEHCGTVHENAQAISSLLRRRPELSGYRKVGFIRHPYQWIRSAHNHSRANPGMFGLHPNVHRKQTIHQFAKSIRRTPLEWLKDEDGNVVCEIWKTEDMPQIMRSLGLELHHKNVKFTAPYEPDDELKAIVRKRFAEDFEHGGYEA